MSDDRHRPLRDDVRLLGRLLGETLREQAGEDVFGTVERLRALSKRANAGDDDASAELARVLRELDWRDAVPLSRAFAHFLGLANIAEQHHRIRRRRAYRHDAASAPQQGSFAETLGSLATDGVDTASLEETIRRMRVELVLTAHPTEVSRRTLLRKHNAIAAGLAGRDRPDLTAPERDALVEELRREIHAIWETDEIHHEKPTPEDEARWGLTVVEQVVWHGLPRVLRGFDRALRDLTGRRLDDEAAPIRFASWMGGDRDGNPNVTPRTTARVCLLSRWMAAELLHTQVDRLRDELSMVEAGPELRELVGDAREPYRAFLRGVRSRLLATRREIEQGLGVNAPGVVHAGDDADRLDDAAPYRDAAELAEALRICRRSLEATDDGRLADGRLLDLQRQLACFGLSLLPLDLRQESTRHTDALDAITTQLGLGSYAGWDEARRIEFLERELAGPRPLIPPDLQASPEVRDVLETLEVASAQPPGSLGAYVISMARSASDVLAVELLQKEAGVTPALRVVPLFETVDDLRGAGDTLTRLLDLPGYRARSAGRLEVMIGYSDSAKDGGRLAAAWELYRAQERIVEICRDHDTSLTLFHGRGGTVGRGGGPTALAIRSQPPGSVDGRLRVTEQGEMIQAKFGLPGIAARTLEVYATSTLRATLQPVTRERDDWRALMDELADRSRAAYRRFVDDPSCIEYFRVATPVRELDGLKIGSRPSKRRPEGGVESLRAIPWIFAWTQMRLMVPSWLGVGEALNGALDEGHEPTLRAMYDGWPFFRSTLDLVEMVLAKAAPRIAVEYERRLVPERLHPIGESLRARFDATVAAVLRVTGHEALLDGNPVLRRSIDVRNPYVDPINLIQVELLTRLRDDDPDDDERLRHALLLTVNGVAAGMRNTG